MPTVNTVYIVDDDPIFVFTVKRVVEMSGFCNQYITFKNGKEAIDEIEQHLSVPDKLPDVVLLDLNMPVMNGWQFLDRLQQIQADKKIIVYIVSSSIDSEDLKKAKEYQSVRQYLIKPLTVAMLKELSEELKPS